MTYAQLHRLFRHGWTRCLSLSRCCLRCAFLQCDSFTVPLSLFFLLLGVRCGGPAGCFRANALVMLAYSAFEENCRHITRSSCPAHELTALRSALCVKEKRCSHSPVRSGGGLRVHFGNLGLFSVHTNARARAFLHFTLFEMWSPRPGIVPATSYTRQPHAIAREFA